MTTTDDATTGVTADSPFLQGNFGPVPDERTVTELEVTGTLPEALAGRLLRDGPNPVGDLLTNSNYHWFMGDGMVHGIELRDGRAVSYRNRWIRTPHVEEHTGLAAAPPSPNSHPMGSGGVNVLAHHGSVLGLGEAGLPYALDADLETVGQWDGDGRLQGNVTAHPKVDPETGELFFFGYDFGPVFLRYYRADADGSVTTAAEIELPHSPMMHDWGVTATRVVWMDLPCLFDLNLIAEGKFPFAWSDDTPARLGVMAHDGRSRDVQWIEIDPCYVFHPLNAYDDGDRIVMDVVRYDRMFDDSYQGPDAEGTLHRWTIDPGASTVREEQLDDLVVEFPRINDGLAGRRHRFGYGAEVSFGDPVDFGGLVKWDLDAGERTVHSMGAGRHTGEGVFVDDPERSGEDGGWILAVVYDDATDRSEVIVLDAADFAAPPVATVHLPVRIPYGFHGNWVPDTALS